MPEVSDVMMLIKINIAATCDTSGIGIIAFNGFYKHMILPASHIMHKDQDDERCQRNEA